MLVVNTCAFIDTAKQESIDAILEMAQQKKRRPRPRLVVTGCLAERYRDELQKEIPEIDAVLGTGEVDQILAALEGSPVAARCGSIASGRRSASDPLAVSPDHRTSRPSPEPRAPSSGLPTYLYDADTPRLLTTPRHFAYVKVAEGCDYTCAFCIIPTLRGKYRSRTAESIVREARALAARGVKELLLISQDTTFYGIDRGERGALARLLRELNAVDGLEWIRLLYLYPTTITDDVLAAMAECEKVCRYIDLPLQHASASVLKRMRRPGDRADLRQLLDRIRDRARRHAADDLHRRLPRRDRRRLRRARAVRRRYRVRPRRRLHLLARGRHARLRARRRRAGGGQAEARNALMARQKKIVARAHRARIGTEVQVLVDGPSPEHELVLQGRLEGRRPRSIPVVSDRLRPVERLRPATSSSADRRRARLRPDGRPSERQTLESAADRGSWNRAIFMGGTVEEIPEWACAHFLFLGAVYAARAT